MNIPQFHNTMKLLREQEILDFDLSDLMLNGKRVFTMGHIERSQMPQLKGLPRKGSVAAFLEVDKKGKVDVQAPFLAWLADTHNVKLHYGEVGAQHIYGSQAELVASKIAGHLPKLQADPEHKKFKALYVIGSDYRLLDGHHGWAAIHLLGMLKDTTMKLRFCQANISATALVELARQFTNVVGILPKEGI